MPWTSRFCTDRFMFYKYKMIYLDHMWLWLPVRRSPFSVFDFFPNIWRYRILVTESEKHGESRNQVPEEGSESEEGCHESIDILFVIFYNSTFFGETIQIIKVRYLLWLNKETEEFKLVGDFSYHDFSHIRIAMCYSWSFIEEKYEGDNFLPCFSYFDSKYVHFKAISSLKSQK